MLSKNALFKAYGRLSYPGAFSVYSAIVFPHRLVSTFIPEDGVIYDMGCGFGVFSLLLASDKKSRKVIGIDTSQRRIDAAQRAAKRLRIENVSFRVGDALDFEEPVCDGMIINNLLHHLDGRANQERFVSQAVKGINPGGRVVIVDIKKKPRYKYYFTLLIDKIMYPGDIIEFPKEVELRQIFQQLSFHFRVVPQEIHKGMPYSYILYTADHSSHSNEE